MSLRHTSGRPSRSALMARVRHASYQTPARSFSVVASAIRAFQCFARFCVCRGVLNPALPSGSSR
uniref:Uncharacterized protein n=1 Tax=Streptomyces violaceoruber TaxID=1935 RepID=Q849I1_STRVN|nr:hypothetical protein [Streptomyces violaceoruber]